MNEKLDAILEKLSSSKKGLQASLDPKLVQSINQLIDAAKAKGVSELPLTATVKAIAQDVLGIQENSQYYHSLAQKVASQLKFSIVKRGRTKFIQIQ